jgi:hypothetical protein
MAQIAKSSGYIAATQTMTGFMFGMSLVGVAAGRASTPEHA